MLLIEWLLDRCAVEIDDGFVQIDLLHSPGRLQLEAGFLDI
jgi:hypothetical protein